MQDNITQQNPRTQNTLIEHVSNNINVHHCFIPVYLPAKATDMNKDWISYTYSVLWTPLVFAWLSTCVNALGRNII